MSLKFKILFFPLLVVLFLSGVFFSQTNKYIVESVYDENSVANDRTKYDISVKYSKDENAFIVDEKIIWKKNDGIIDSCYLNIPTKYLKDFTQVSAYDFKIGRMTINAEPIEFTNVNYTSVNFVKNSLIKFKLPKSDSWNYKFRIEYKIIFPSNKSILNERFYTFENWYFTLPAIVDGKFKPYPTHKFIESFHDFADYKVSISLPDAFGVEAFGSVLQKKENGTVHYKCEANGLRIFNWFAYRDLVSVQKTIETNGSSCNIKILIDENKDGYLPRYFDAISKYQKMMSGFPLPYNSLTIIDLPGTDLPNKSFPGIIAINSDLISPLKTLKLEKNLANLFAEQYFGNRINSDRISESWLSKGISNFIGDKLVGISFGEPVSFFKIADYYPVYGLLFMDYFGLPIIYTIGITPIPLGAGNIEKYYKNQNYGNLSLPTYMLPNAETNHVASVIKPNLSLISYRNFLGADDFDAKMDMFISQSVNKVVSAKDFKKVFTNNVSDEIVNLFHEFFESGKRFDYEVKNVVKREDNKWDIIVVRNEDGVTPVKLSVRTIDEEYSFYWSGEEEFHVFTVSPKSEIISADIDSENINILDSNFSNNSFTVERKYWGSFSYATRVFFWFQNALMLIGGAG